MRSLAAILAPLLLALGGASAQTLPAMPEPEPAPYLAPKLVLDGMGFAAGQSGTRSEGGTWYDPAASLRVTLTIAFGERLSDDRAKASWRAGWLKAADAYQPIVATEHDGRLKAEASASFYKAQADVAATPRSAWDDVKTAAPWTALGLGLGVVAGILIGGG